MIEIIGYDTFNGKRSSAKRFKRRFVANTTELENEREKLIRKNEDAIVLNSLNDTGAGFKHETNKISIILRKGIIFEYPLKDKNLVAKDIITCISENLK